MLKAENIPFHRRNRKLKPSDVRNAYPVTMANIGLFEQGCNMHLLRESSNGLFHFKKRFVAGVSLTPTWNKLKLGSHTKIPAQLRSQDGTPINNNKLRTAVTSGNWLGGAMRFATGASSIYSARRDRRIWRWNQPKCTIERSQKCEPTMVQFVIP